MSGAEKQRLYRFRKELALWMYFQFLDLADGEFFYYQPIRLGEGYEF